MRREQSNCIFHQLDCVISCHNKFMKDGHLLSCCCHWCRISFPLFLQHQLLLALKVNLKKGGFYGFQEFWLTFSRAVVATPFLVASAQSFSRLRRFHGEESRLLQKNCWNSLMHGNDFNCILIGRQTCNFEDCSRSPCKGLQLYFCQAQGEKSTQILAQASLNPPIKHWHVHGSFLVWKVT